MFAPDYNAILRRNQTLHQGAEIDEAPMDIIFQILADTAENVGVALKGLIVPAAFALIVAIRVKGAQWLPDLRRALPEMRLSLKILMFNVIVTAPFMFIAMTAFHHWLLNLGVTLFKPSDWEALPSILVMFAALFICDFFSYWRHRLDHSPLLWPAHAVHHSDTNVTWITSARWHPINLLTVRGLVGGAMLLVGFPVYALVFNSMARGLYGYFIHMDVPWTYGKWGQYIVSPAMHRWHHSAEEKAFDKNFAEFFCVFDKAFGTFYLPGPCNGPLGVHDDMEPTLRSQIGYAFSPRAYRGVFRRMFGREERAGETAL